MSFYNKKTNYKFNSIYLNFFIKSNLKIKYLKFLGIKLVNTKNIPKF